MESPIWARNVRFKLYQSNKTKLISALIVNKNKPFADLVHSTFSKWILIKTFGPEIFFKSNFTRDSLLTASQRSNIVSYHSIHKSHSEILIVKIWSHLSKHTQCVAQIHSSTSSAIFLRKNIFAAHKSIGVKCQKSTKRSFVLHFIYSRCGLIHNKFFFFCKSMQNKSLTP